MAGSAQVYITFFIDNRPGSVHIAGQTAFREHVVQLVQDVLVGPDGHLLPAHFLRQFFQDAQDLLLFRQFQFPQLVVHVDDGLGLHEQRSAGSALIVDDARQSRPVLRLDGHHVATLPHGDDSVLQVGLVVRRVYDLVDLAADILVLLKNGPADAAQFGTGAIGDLVLRQDASLDLVLQVLQHRDGGNKALDRLHRLQFFSVQKRLGTSGRLQVICHLQQLLRGQAALLCRQVHDALDVVEPAQRRRSFLEHHLHGFVRRLQLVLDPARFAGRL